MRQFLALILMLSYSANAHHSTVANFTQEIITVDGVIEQVRYKNPHASVLIKNTGDNGKEIFWLIEMGAKTTLERQGVTLDRLAVGSKITASGQKGRRQYTMYLQEIVFEDGSVFSPEGEAADVRDKQIRAELVQMADDFVSFRMMQGFEHEMPLAEAYRWQDEMIEIMEPAMGEVVGYKTGGHDPGPGFATFPPEGIRAYILAGMLRDDGAAIKIEDSVVGFLEADFAFRVGNASINDAETDLEILAGLDAIIPFAEVPDPYYDPDTRTINGTIVANMGTRMSFTGAPVMIEPTAEWLQRINTFKFAVLDENDKVIQSGTMDSHWETLALFARSMNGHRAVRRTKVTSFALNIMGLGKTGRQRSRSISIDEKTYQPTPDCQRCRFAACDHRFRSPWLGWL
jgi:2-keto-4-pentenoate hydratase